MFTPRYSIFESGDFPAIYGGVKTLQSENAEKLYDLTWQQKIQEEYFKDGDGFLPSAYPPYFYQLLKPLAFFNAQSAKLIWDVAASLAFILILLILKSQNAFFTENKLFCTALFMVSPFFLASSFGGQNTNFLILFMLLAGLCFKQKTSSYHFLGGCTLALLLLKPQYGVLAICLVLLSRSIYSFSGYILVASIFWVLGVSASGVAWPTQWIGFVSQFAINEYKISLGQMCSFDALIAWCFDLLNLRATYLVPILGAGLGLLLVTPRLSTEIIKVRVGDENFFRVVLLWMTLIPLVAPHTIYYDLSIGLIGFLGFLKAESDKVRAFILGGWLLLMLYGWTRTEWNFPILFPVSALLAFFAARSFQRILSNDIRHLSGIRIEEKVE